MRRRTSIAYFFRAEKKKFPRTKHVRENSGYLLEKRLVVDLLALADLEAFFELLGGVGRVDGLDLLLVHHHAALLDKPNNNLAVEYCRAIRSLAPRMEAYPLPRQGANHGEALHSAHGQFASASALRKLWAEGGADAVAPYVPEAVFPLYQEAYAAGQYTDFSAAGRCELALLRSACRGKAPFADIRGVSEGLEHRLEAAVRTSTTYDELLDALTTVRYPRARMRRLAMDAALGCTADSLPALPPYLHLLGGKKDALPFLKNCTLPVSHSLARLRGSGGACTQMAEAQLAAADFGTLCRVSPEAMGGLLRQKNIFLT